MPITGKGVGQPCIPLQVPGRTGQLLPARSRTVRDTPETADVPGTIALCSWHVHVLVAAREIRANSTVRIKPGTDGFDPYKVIGRARCPCGVGKPTVERITGKANQALGDSETLVAEFC